MNDIYDNMNDPNRLINYEESKYHSITDCLSIDFSIIDFLTIILNS